MGLSTVVMKKKQLKTELTFTTRSLDFDKILDKQQP